MKDVSFIVFPLMLITIVIIIIVIIINIIIIVNIIKYKLQMMNSVNKMPHHVGKKINQPRNV